MLLFFYPPYSSITRARVTRPEWTFDTVLYYCDPLFLSVRDLFVYNTVLILPLLLAP